MGEAARVRHADYGDRSATVLHVRGAMRRIVEPSPDIAGADTGFAPRGRVEKRRGGPATGSGRTVLSSSQRLNADSGTRTVRPAFTWGSAAMISYARERETLKSLAISVADR
jgi:hypothetical protein